MLPPKKLSSYRHNVCGQRHTTFGQFVVFGNEDINLHGERMIQEIIEFHFENCIRRSFNALKTQRHYY